MLDFFLIFFFFENIFVLFSIRVLQQTFGFHLTTISAILLSDLFLYSDEADVMQVVLKKNDKIKYKNIFSHCELSIHM